MPELTLKHKESVIINPQAPYNFNANFHKPSHFPSSDCLWEEDNCWISMLWQGQKLGLKFSNTGTIDKPAIKIDIYSRRQLSEDFLDSLIPEIRWRFNFDSDISEFYEKYGNDKILGPIIKKWKGMKPIAANSLYETLVIYVVLQNATVKRSVQMMENLFEWFGSKLSYDNKTVSTFWKPEEITASSEQELRDLKLGYRAKFIMRISQQFADKEINEFELRKRAREEIRQEILRLYGIGPASVEYLLFEDFYFNDALVTIPPWEQKIMSRLVFNEALVPVETLLEFFSGFKGWAKLAFNYIWEDIFWRRKHEHIEWLEKEIRL